MVVSTPAPVNPRHPAPGGVAAVDRALALLAAWAQPEPALTLAELAARTGLHKSTALRLLASLQHARLVQRLADGRYELGPEVARLGTLYAASFSLPTQLLPLMQRLVARTHESAAFHVRQEGQRVCLLRVDSPQLLRDHVRVGEVLPLNRGAGGRVLQAFSSEPGARRRGARGAVYDRIRAEGVAVLHGDRVPGLTGISAPVWGAQGQLVGALTLTLPEPRMQAGFVVAVREAAAQATRALGGVPQGDAHVA